MRSFLLRRLLLAVLVCLTVLVVSFTLTRLSGDLAASIAGPNASAADIAIITRNYGLDRPLVVQFLDWASHSLRTINKTIADNYDSEPATASSDVEPLPWRHRNLPVFSAYARNMFAICPSLQHRSPLPPCTS